MIAAVNFPDRKALMENGETVPTAFYLNGETVENFEDCDSLVAGPYHEWNGKRYDRKFAKVDKNAIHLLEGGAEN